MESNYAVHVADLSAQLSTHSTKSSVRAALTCLREDGLAQVMSFVSVHTLTHCMRTLAAVGPQLRLDAEALTSRSGCCGDANRVRAEGDGRLVFTVAATESSSCGLRQRRSMWWGLRCRLPLVLELENNRSDVLAQLGGRLRCRVAALTVHLFSTPHCVRDCDVSTCDGSCGTLLCSLATFSSLTRLSVVCRSGADRDAVASAVKRALRVAARMAVSEVALCGVARLRDFSALAGSQQLRVLKATHCGIQSVAALVSCPLLAVLGVSGNRELRTLAGLAGALYLERLSVRHCGLENLEGLCRCPRLSEVDVVGNTVLTEFDGLAGAPCLERVAASCCGLRSVGGLNCCPWLCEVDVSNNRLLGDLSGLAGAPSLLRVCASGCQLRSIDGLGACPRLSELNVSSNGSLQDLSGLAGAPALTKVTAVKCGLRRVGVLARCPLLLELTVHYNCFLEDLEGVAGAPCLEKITAWNCGLRSVDGLGSCPRLREAALWGNKALTDLGDLATSTSLRRLNVSGSLVAAPHRFAACVEVVQ